jgi:dTMP kinase
VAKGLFITFEGGEGAGKSTQVQLLADRLKSLGRDVVVTREPGGTPQGEAVRSLLVNGATDAWSANAEALLNYAARDAHLNVVIRPALSQGKTVLCDRFFDSTLIYQGHAGGADPELVATLAQSIVGNDIPDLTLVFDLDPELGLKRAGARGAGFEDRYERKGLAFHKALREGFKFLPVVDPQRCKLIDASQPIEAVSAAIQAHVEDLLNG